MFDGKAARHMGWTIPAGLIAAGLAVTQAQPGTIGEFFGVSSSDVSESSETSSSFNGFSPELSIGDIDFSEKNMTITYDDSVLTMPLQVDIIANNGWRLSDDLTYGVDADPEDDLSDAAVYTHADYAGSSCIVSSCSVPDMTRVSGSQRALKSYGIYSITMHVDADSPEKPDIMLCGESLFETDSSVMYNALMDTGFDMSSITRDGTVSTHFFGYDFDDSFVELSITYSEDTAVGFSIKLTA